MNRMDEEQDIDYAMPPVRRVNPQIKNLEVTEHVIRKTKKNKFSLRTGTAIILGAAVVLASGLIAKEKISEMRKANIEDPFLSFSDQIEETKFLDMADIDFDSLTVVLKDSGGLGLDIVDKTEELLREVGVDVIKVNSYETANLAVGMSQKEKSVVIDVNSLNNKSNPVLLTNYANENRLASDALALGVKGTLDSWKDLELRAGRGHFDGSRSETEVEMAISNPSVATLTLAINSENKLDEMQSNSYALALYEGIAKYANFDLENSKELMHRAKWGDSLSALKDKYNETVSDLNRGHLITDDLVVIGNKPELLSDKTRVKSPFSLTCESDEISYRSETYEVQSGDTLEGIREKLNNKNIGKDLEDPNYLQVGQQLNYLEKENSPMLVVPALVNNNFDLRNIK